MEKFKEYSDILNIKKDFNKYSEIEKGKIKNQIIESVGSYDNYKIFEDAGYDYIMLYESDLINQIKSKSKQYDIEWGGQLVQTLVSWLMQPITTKLGLEKNSLAWYMVSWGVVEVAFEFKDEMTRLDKKPVNWCNIFTKGATEGILAWLTHKNLHKLLNMIGFNTSKSSGNIAGALQTGIVSWIKEGTLDVFIEQHLCEEGGLWDEFAEEAKGILGNVGSYVSTGIDNIGKFIKSIF